MTTRSDASSREDSGRQRRTLRAVVCAVAVSLAIACGVVASICGAPDGFDETCGNFRGDVPLGGLSFVSGHAIIAWGVATLLWPVLPSR